MIILNKSNNSESIIVTLNESTTINEPYYLFRFKHVTTNLPFEFLFSSVNDVSLYQQRFNEFIINTSDLFSDAPLGQYQYKVYERVDAGSDPIDEASLLECGKMLLKEDEAEIYSTFDTETTYTT
jgi:hypothetical protein